MPSDAPRGQPQLSILLDDVGFFQPPPSARWGLATNGNGLWVQRHFMGPEEVRHLTRLNCISQIDASNRIYRVMGAFVSSAGWIAVVNELFQAEDPDAYRQAEEQIPQSPSSLNIMLRASFEAGLQREQREMIATVVLDPSLVSVRPADIDPNLRIDPFVDSLSNDSGWDRFNMMGVSNENHKALVSESVLNPLPPITRTRWDVLLEDDADA